MSEKLSLQDNQSHDLLKKNPHLNYLEKCATIALSQTIVEEEPASGKLSNLNVNYFQSISFKVA